jgi:hypothetical protein
MLAHTARTALYASQTRKSLQNHSGEPVLATLDYVITCSEPPTCRKLELNDARTHHWAAFALQALTVAVVTLGPTVLQGSSLRHGYVQLESLGTAHIKSTVIRQHARSQYALTEACIGGDLARHDVDVQQVPYAIMLYCGACAAPA